MERLAQIKKLSEKDKVWDIVVVGGGATGLGVAVDAARRGIDGDARHERGAARKNRLCEMHFEPQYQARTRRRALPAEGRRHAGARSAARTRPHEGERPPSGERPSLRDLELQVLG